MLKPTDPKAKAIPEVRKYLVAYFNWQATYRAFWGMSTAPKGMGRPTPQQLDERHQKFHAARTAAAERMGSLENLEQYTIVDARA